MMASNAPVLREIALDEADAMAITARRLVENDKRFSQSHIDIMRKQANLPSGNTNSDKTAVINEANLAATAKIPIVTIALGAYADTDLMQQVADITGGAAFVVAGGQPIATVKTQLEAVFGEVAADRPLKLVD